MGLLDPETWKAPAELIGYWKTIASAIVGAGLAFSAATKKGREFIDRGWAAVRGRRPHSDWRTVGVSPEACKQERAVVAGV